MAYQDFISQALKDMYGKRQKQQQGYGQGNQGYGGYGGYGGLMQRPAEQQQYGGIPQPLTPQTSTVSEALTQTLNSGQYGQWANIFQNTPTTWDWQGGEPAPMGIQTPWLGYNWHYDEFGRAVPNDPNNPMAPWILENTGMSMEEYYDYMGGLFPESMFGKKDIGQVGGSLNAT